MKQRFTSLRPMTDLPEVNAVLRAHPAIPGTPGQSWYSINNLSRDEAEVFIYDEIGMWGITASEFMNDFAGIKAKTINLRINSPGGDVSDGVAIFNAIRRHDATVNVFVDGIAASVASVIAMAGDTVTMSPHSQMMIHDAWGFAMGPADEMRKMADILDKTSDNIAGIYAEHAGGTVGEWRERMVAETWFSDQEAVDAGLADGIDGVEAQDKQATPVVNAIPEEPEAEPDTVPLDFRKHIEELAEAEEEALYATA